MTDSSTLRLAVAAVQEQAALGETSRGLQINSENGLAWGIGDAAVSVINAWLTYEFAGDNARAYAIGAVMALEVAVRASVEQYLRAGEFVGPVAV